MTKEESQTGGLSNDKKQFWQRAMTEGWIRYGVALALVALAAGLRNRGLG